MDHPEPLPSPWDIHIYEQSPSKFFEARLGRRYLTIPSADHFIGGQPLKIIVTNVCLIQKPSENYRFQWLPPTIPFNSDGTPENHRNFSLLAKTRLKPGLNCCLEKSKAQRMRDFAFFIAFGGGTSKKIPKIGTQ